MSMKFSIADLLTKHHHRQRWTVLETATWAAKILFLAIGIASTTAAAAKLTLPYILSLLSLPLPKLYSSATSYISPLYLFITVHFIIAVIWKLHDIHTLHDSQNDHHDIDLVPGDSPFTTESAESTPSITENHSRIITTAPSDAADIKEAIIVEQVPWPPPEDANTSNLHEAAIEDDGDDDNNDYSSSTPIPDGLDATWKAIMEGKSSPVRNQIKKSDTWEKPSNYKLIPPRLAKAVQPLSREAAVDNRVFKKSDTFRETQTTTTVEKKEMRKSRTFRETGESSSSAGWRRRRDVLVMSQDELFHKGEAFIKMNYDQMRMQRQESILNAAC